ncbi:hypothetical protein AMTRI_Chr08g207130 [Amborella trichopoda]
MKRTSNHEREEAPLDHYTPPALSSALSCLRSQHASIYSRSPARSSIRALSSVPICPRSNANSSTPV